MPKSVKRWHAIGRFLLMVESFERQPGEGLEAFQAFSIYLDQAGGGVGKRSTSRVAEQLSKSRTLILRWCTRWRWVERCREYDRYIDKLARQEREREILAYRKRVAQQMRGMAQTLMLPAMALSAKLAADPDALHKLQQLEVADLVALASRCAFALPNITKAEAAALGDVAERRELPESDDDVLTRAIEQDEDLLSVAATMIERASARIAANANQPQKT
jgi:hypothetical protein